MLNSRWSWKSPKVFSVRIEPAPFSTVMTPSATVHAAGDLPSTLTHPSRSLPLKSTTAPSGGFLPRVASLGSASAATAAAAAHPRNKVTAKQRVRIATVLHWLVILD